MSRKMPDDEFYPGCSKQMNNQYPDKQFLIKNYLDLQKQSTIIKYLLMDSIPCLTKTFRGVENVLDVLMQYDS